MPIFQKYFYELNVIILKLNSLSKVIIVHGEWLRRFKIIQPANDNAAFFIL